MTNPTTGTATVTTYDPGPGGWLRCETEDISRALERSLLGRVADQQGAAWVRFTDDGGRLVPAQVVLSGAVTTDTLRGLHLGRAEAWANGPGAARLRAKMDDPAPDPAADLDQAVPRRRRRGKDTATAPGRIEVPAGGPGPGRGRGDDFYRQVAAVYTAAAAQGQPPGDAVKKAAGRRPDGDEWPPSTVNRWVREARRKGFLAPGRVGRVG